VACLGVVGNVVQAWRHGWVLEGDNAAIAINTFDTIHGHFRMVGVHSSAVTYAGIGDFYHPGPMLYWVSAVPAGLFDWGPAGFLFVAALINCASLIGVAVFVRRRAGDRVATVVTAAGALLVWSLGTEIPHDVWNPHIAVLPWFLALVLFWSVLEGDRAALVVLAFVVSFSVQDHFSYLPLVGPLVVGVAVTIGLRLWRQRRADPAAWASDRRSWARSGLAALVVLTLCWLPVLIQQLTGDPKNISQLVRFVRAGSPRGRQGASFALGRFFGFLGSRPLWLDRQVDFDAVMRDPSLLDVVVSVVVVGAAAGLCWYHLFRGRRTIGRLLALCLASIVLLFVSTVSLPKEISSALPPNYMPWWPVCLMTLVGIAWGALALTRPSWRRPVPLIAIVVALAFTVTTVVSTDPAGDRSIWAFPAIRALNEQVRAKLPNIGPYYVADQGGMAFLSLANPLILDLARHGYDVRVPAYREPSLGTFRSVDRRHLAGIVLVASGPTAVNPPTGATVLARVPVGVGTPATRYLATSYPVVAYLLPPSKLDAVGGL